MIMKYKKTNMYREKKAYIFVMVLTIIALIIAGTNLFFAYLPEWGDILTYLVLTACNLAMLIINARVNNKKDNSKEQ